MEIVLKTTGDKIDELTRRLFGDDVVSRGSILVRDGRLVGTTGYYCRIIGREDQCLRALELAGDLAEKVEGEELQTVLGKLRQEEEQALSGFSSLF